MVQLIRTCSVMVYVYLVMDKTKWQAHAQKLMEDKSDFAVVRH